MASVKLNLEKKSARVVTRMIPRLHELSKDRVRVEWKKMFLSAHPSIGLMAAKKLGILAVFFPKIFFIGKNILSVDAASCDWVVRLAAFCFGKKATEVQRILAAIGVAHDVCRMVIHLCDVRVPAVVPKDGEARQLARSLHPATIAQWLAVARATGVFAAQCRFVETCARRLRILNRRPADIVSGRDFIRLGFGEGPRIGRLIAKANFLHDADHLTKHEVLAQMRVMKRK